MKQRMLRNVMDESLGGSFLYDTILLISVDKLINLCGPVASGLP